MKTRISIFWIIAGISVLLAFTTEAKTLFEVPDNILENPSAEEIIADKPGKWSLYIGNGAFRFGFADKESYSGKRSAYLTVLALGDGDGVNAAIIAGDTNGYDGSRAYECQEETEYFYAFYAKAEDAADFKRPLRVLLWSWKAGFQAKDRVTPRAVWINLTSEWARYEGSFKTSQGTKRCALGVGPYGVKATKIKATYYVDDAYLGLTRPPVDQRLAVGASDKLATTWGRIRRARSK